MRRVKNKKSNLSLLSGLVRPQWQRFLPLLLQDSPATGYCWHHCHHWEPRSLPGMHPEHFLSLCQPLHSQSLSLKRVQVVQCVDFHPGLVSQCTRFPRGREVFYKERPGLKQEAGHFCKGSCSPLAHCMWSRVFLCDSYAFLFLFVLFALQCSLGLPTSCGIILLIFLVFFLKAFSLSPLSLILALGIFIGTISQVENFPVCQAFTECFDHKQILNFVKCFFASTRMITTFFFILLIG